MFPHTWADPHHEFQEMVQVDSQGGTTERSHQHDRHADGVPNVSRCVFWPRHCISGGRGVSLEGALAGHFLRFHARRSSSRLAVTRHSSSRVQGFWRRVGAAGSQRWGRWGVKVESRSTRRGASNHQYHKHQFRQIYGNYWGEGMSSNSKGFSQKAGGRIWLSLFLSFHKRGCRQPWTDRWGRWGSGRGEQAIGRFSTTPGGSTAAAASCCWIGRPACH